MSKKTIKQPQGLISVLLDRAAEFGDRDDAAMDLAAFDEPEAMSALNRIVEDGKEDLLLVETCKESINEIQRRKNI